MAKPTTVRIPDDLLKEIGQFVKKLRVDRSVYPSEVLRKGFSIDKQERVLSNYAQGELSLPEACKELKCNPWEFLAMLHSRNLHINVTLEDWLDSKDLGI